MCDSKNLCFYFSLYFSKFALASLIENVYQVKTRAINHRFFSISKYIYIYIYLYIYIYIYYFFTNRLFEGNFWVSLHRRLKFAMIRTFSACSLSPCLATQSFRAPVGLFAYVVYLSFKHFHRPLLRPPFGQF